MGGREKKKRKKENEREKEREEPKQRVKLVVLIFNLRGSLNETLIFNLN